MAELGGNQGHQSHHGAENAPTGSHSGGWTSMTSCLFISMSRDLIVRTIITIFLVQFSIVQGSFVTSPCLRLEQSTDVGMNYPTW